MYLETKQIEDWPQFIDENDIQLTCGTCEGEGVIDRSIDCPECNGTGDTESTCKRCAGEGSIEDEDAQSYNVKECPDCEGNGIIYDKCTDCNGTGSDTCEEECPDCGGSPDIEFMWNTIWNTGFSTHMEFKLCPAPDVFAFAYDGNIWFGLSACGMDCTPQLALAWVNTFPDCKWLPDQFYIRGCNLSGGYIKACVGPENARQIYKLMRNDCELRLEQAKSDLETIEKVIEATGHVPVE